ncbi:MAG TPA: zf-HC2 domain-containing protein, partial [Myxococcota bacterium]
VHVDCRKMATLLGDYVDEDLAPELKTAVDAHMSQCAPCMAFLKQYRFAPEAARKMLLKAVPAELEERVLSFLRGKCKRD